METLKIIDNFKKIENVKSNMLYGKILDKASITIGMPIYGYNKYFKDAIFSILNQKSNSIKFQIIISDNYEYQNNSNEVINFLKSLNSDCIAYYLTDKEIGQYNNFNRLIELCRTKYLIYLHDDDLLANDYFLNLEKIMPFLINNNNIGLIHGNFIRFKGNIPINISKKKIYLKRITKLDIDCAGTTTTGIPSCGIVINCDVMKKIGGYNNVYFASGDAFPAAIMIKHHFKIYRFGFLTGYYRIAINASLKLNMCRGFIEQDYAFYCDWKNSSRIFRKIYLTIFENYFYSRKIDFFVKDFSAFNNEITKENLDYLKKYKKYHKFGLLNLMHKSIEIINRFLSLFHIKYF